LSLQNILSPEQHNNQQMDNMLLNNVKEAREIIRLKEKYPEVMTNDFVDLVINETHDQVICRRYIKEYIEMMKPKELFKELEETRTLQDLEKQIQNERMRTETVKFVSEKSIKGPCITKTLMDYCNNYYLYYNDDEDDKEYTVYNLNDKKNPVVKEYDIDDIDDIDINYYDTYIWRLKSNGIPYIILKIRQPRIETAIYDFETNKLISFNYYYPIYDDNDNYINSGLTDDIHDDDNNIVYGSKYICIINKTTIKIYNHKKKFVKLVHVPYGLYGSGGIYDSYVNHCPKRIGNGLIYCFHEIHGLYLERTFDLNYDAKNRLRALIYYKHPEGPTCYKHVPKEIMLHIYSFLCI
jgi:hypothetical protein